MKPVCPICNSKNVEENKMDNDDPLCGGLTMIFCHDCGYDQSEVYRLNHKTIINER